MNVTTLNLLLSKKFQYVAIILNKKEKVCVVQLLLVKLVLSSVLSLLERHYIALNY